MVEIRYEDGFPQEMQPTVTELISKWAPYFCGTVNRIFVRMANDPVEAGIDVRYQYRVANLYLMPGWFTFDDDMRERIIVHELTHILTDPVTRWAESFLSKMSDQTLSNMAHEWFSENMEGMTEDIARAIFLAHENRQLSWAEDEEEESPEEPEE